MSGSQEDTYKTKPQLAIEIIKELQKWNLNIKLVLADSLYGESGDVITVLEQLNLEYIVAIRSNHKVWMFGSERKRYNRWKPYQQKLSRQKSETRYIREIIFGKRKHIRFYQISKKEDKNPEPKDTWFIPSQHLQLGFSKLINIMNRFRGSPFPQSYSPQNLTSVAC